MKILLGIIVLFLLCLVGYAFLQNQRPAVRVNSPLATVDEAASEKEEKPELSESNRVAAKNALNAVGELESVASVGANYLQFTESLQSAKIKFDAAMRDFEIETESDEKIRCELQDVFVCYVDAKDAWSEFIEDGDEYGFLRPKSYSKVRSLASTYDLEMKDGEYSRSKVLRTILEAASEKFNDVRKFTK